MPETLSPPSRIGVPDMHHVRDHVPRCKPGSLISGFLWSRLRGKRPRHSWCMRNPKFYVPGKRPMLTATCSHIAITRPINTAVYESDTPSIHRRSWSAEVSVVAIDRNIIIIDADIWCLLLSIMILWMRAWHAHLNDMCYNLKVECTDMRLRIIYVEALDSSQIILLLNRNEWNRVPVWKMVRWMMILQHLEQFDGSRHSLG